MAMNRESKPDFVSKFNPTAGGYDGGSVEAGGAPGDKMEDGFTTPGGDSANGNYASAGSSFRGVGPNGTSDPELEGPPLGTVVGPNGGINQ